MHTTTYIHTYTPTYIHTYIPTYIHTYIQHTYIHTYIQCTEEESVEINKALEGIDHWDWDVRILAEKTNKRPLQTLGWHLMHKW